jgi:hypothetical protein
VGVDHAQVEGCQENVGVGESNEHGVVGHWVTLVDLASGLVSETSVVTGNLKGSVGQVELVDPGNELGCAGRGGGNVRVVGTNSLTGHLPGQVKKLARERERLGAVAGNARSARVARVLSRVDVDTALLLGNGGVAGVSNALSSNLVGLGVVGREAVGVSLVVDEQGREVLPCEASGVLGARADIRGKVSPRPRLGDTSLKPNGHGCKTEHLTEGHLLASLGGNGLGQKLTDLARVEVVDESPNTRLTPAGKLLVEVDELANSAVGVVVGALRSSSLAEHVGEQSSVTSFLNSHESNVGAVFSSKASVKEVLVGEDSKTVVEQVKLDPLLVETKLNGLVVEVTVHLVTGLSAIGTEATSRCVGNRHGVLRQTVGVVIGGSRVRWERRNSSSQSRRGFSSSSDGGLTRVWSMAGSASHIRTPARRS